MNRIEEEAQRLLRDVGVTRSYIDVDEVAQHLGVRVVRSEMPHDVSGMLIREGGSLTVGLNQSQSLNRRRFTLAHEIGHLLLHRGRPLILDSTVRVNYRDARSARATDREEMDANGFAAALLMPAAMIIEAVDAFQAPSTDSADQFTEDLRRHLADRFHVSPEAMGYRLVNLGILS